LLAARGWHTKALPRVRCADALASPQQCKWRGVNDHLQRWLHFSGHMFPSVCRITWLCHRTRHHTRTYKCDCTTEATTSGKSVSSIRGATRKRPEHHQAGTAAVHLPSRGCSAGVTTPVRDAITVANQLPHAGVRNGAPAGRLVPLAGPLVSHLPCQATPTEYYTHPEQHLDHTQMHDSAQTNRLLGRPAPTRDNCTKLARRHVSETPVDLGRQWLAIAKWPLALLSAALTSGCAANPGGRSAR